MRQESKSFTNRVIHFIEVTEDAYRFDLVTNKALKDRYGKLEWVSRGDGHDRSITFPNIENLVIIGLDKDVNEVTASHIVGKGKDALKRYNKLKKELEITTEKKERPVQKGAMLESNAAYFKRLGKWMVEDEKVWKNLLVLIEWKHKKK